MQVAERCCAGGQELLCEWPRADMHVVDSVVCVLNSCCVGGSGGIILV